MTDIILMETYDSDDESVESYKTDVENPLINDIQGWRILSKRYEF